MGHIEPKVVYVEDDNGRKTDQVLAYIHNASEESVKLVLAETDEDDDGRSQWMWVRLQNGDLILGVFPQGDTYCSCEVDAATPSNL